MNAGRHDVARVFVILGKNGRKVGDTSQQGLGKKVEKSNWPLQVDGANDNRSILCQFRPCRSRSFHQYLSLRWQSCLDMLNCGKTDHLSIHRPRRFLATLMQIASCSIPPWPLQSQWKWPLSFQLNGL